MEVVLLVTLVIKIISIDPYIPWIGISDFHLNVPNDVPMLVFELPFFGISIVTESANHDVDILFAKIFSDLIKQLV